MKSSTPDYAAYRSVRPVGAGRILITDALKRLVGLAAMNVCGALLLLACPVATTSADDCSGDCCAHCGCHSNCCKVCRLVPDVKKVPKVTYTCECEDFCVPGRSEHCVTYDECGNKQHCYAPTCGKVRTRTKLVKHETMVEKPGYKCVVESLCGACAANCNCNGKPEGTINAKATEQSNELIRTSLVTPSLPAASRQTAKR